MVKKHQKCPLNGGFPLFVTSKIFSKNRLSHFCTLLVPLPHAKKLEKTNRQSLRYLKTEQQTNQGLTDRGDQMVPL